MSCIDRGKDVRRGGAQFVGHHQDGFGVDRDGRVAGGRGGADRDQVGAALVLQESGLEFRLVELVLRR